MRFSSRILMLLCCLLAGARTLLAQNYDEQKVRPYVLPDLLLTQAGEKVATPAEWEKVRRPEILGLFEEHVYGRMPAGYDRISYRVVRQDAAAMQGKAILREVVITVTQKAASLDIHLTLFVPVDGPKPSPAILLINNRSPRNTLASRDTISGFWPAEQVIAAGYAIGAFHYSDAAADHQDTFKNGVLRLYPELASAANGMKAVGAWAWAASRVMDYLETDRDIDAGKVAIVGHSRGGKAALWAGAQDQRFAMVFSNCSGNTGPALSRRKFGETIARINTTFPHWFNDRYKKYNNNEEALPVDQHMLIALMAPRPVYVTNATEDLWADPTGTFLAMKQAEPVFTLYNLPSHLPATPPGADQPIVLPPLGYHNRTGGHDMTFFDWKQFTTFADAYYKLKQVPRK